MAESWSSSRIDPGSEEYYKKNLAFYLKGYNEYMAMKGEVSPYSKAAMQYFAPGGGYGQGQKLTAKKMIQQGVAADTIAGVNTGMSSMSSARGLQTRGKEALATRYGNIEDTRATLGLQANSAYINMMNSLSSMLTGYPKYDPVVLQSGGSAGGGGTSGGGGGGGQRRGGLGQSEIPRGYGGGNVTPYEPGRTAVYNTQQELTNRGYQSNQGYGGRDYDYYTDQYTAQPSSYYKSYGNTGIDYDYYKESDW